MPGESLLREKVMSYLTGLSPAARAMLLRRLEIADGEARLDGEMRMILDAARAMAGAPATPRSAAPPQPRSTAPLLQAGRETGRRVLLARYTWSEDASDAGRCHPTSASSRRPGTSR